MKKRILLFAMLMAFTHTNGQDISVEKSIFGIQTGLFGIWGHNEFRMSNELAFRSEIGFEVGVWGGSYYENEGEVSLNMLLKIGYKFEPKK